MPDETQLRTPPWSVVGWMVLLVLVVGLSWRSHGVFQLGAFHDDAKYTLLARSLLGSDSYGVHTGAAEPFPHPYPFGFPLLLLPLERMCTARLDCLTLLPLAATLANVTLLFWGWPLLSGTRSRWWALAVAGGYALHPWTIVQTNMVLSEPVFTTLVLGVLLLTERCIQSAPPRTATLIALGWLLTWVPFTRTSGIALWPVVWFRILWRSNDARRRGLALIAGTGLLLLPVLAMTSVAPGDLVPYRYVESIIWPSMRGREPAEDSLAIRVARGIDAYASRFVRLSILPFGGGEQERALGRRVGIDDLPRALGLGVTASVLIGAFARPRLASSVLLFEIAHAAATLSWYARDTRLLYPIQPFLFFQFLLGIRLLLQLALPQRFLSRLGVSLSDRTIAAMVVTLAAFAVTRSAQPHSPSTQHTRDYRAGATWLREHSAADAVIMAEESFTVHLYARRAIVPFPPARSAYDLRTALARDGVDYVLLAPWGTWREDGQLDYTARAAQRLLPEVRALVASGELQRVYESEPREKVEVFRVVHR
jgi:hypothetical protein